VAKKSLVTYGALVMFGGSIAMWAQIPSPAYSGSMAECEDTSGCSTWTFENNHAEGHWSNGGVAELTIKEFSGSVKIERVDEAGTGQGIKALYTGVRNGDRIDGTLSWVWPGHQSGTTNWHATIQRPMPAPNTLATNGPLTTFMYPGTNYRTQLVAINDSGVAVGWFSPPVQGPICDPVAFGGPCLPIDPSAAALNIPYAFSYSDGKFKRLRGPLVEVGNNMPLAINNRGQVLLVHGHFANLPGGGADLLLYDLATGTTRAMEQAGLPAKGDESLLVGNIGHVSGMNSKGIVAGAGMLTEMEGGSPKHEYGLLIGTPNVHAISADPDSGTSSFKHFEVALPSCPKKEANVQYTDMKLAGPNDAGQIAISCGNDAVVYDSALGRSKAFSAPDPQYKIKVSGIANGGAVVGCSAVPGGKAFVYSGGNFAFLPISGEKVCALGVNAKGQIVGFSDDKAFIYKP
jgi:hypothetical protein